MENINACEKARDKLNAEECKFKNADKAFLVPYVRDTLITFVTQSEEFAKAVLDSGQTLTKCIDSLKLAGKRASDLDEYNECVKFFMPDAIVEFEMKIKLPTHKDHNAIILNLEDFFN